MPYDEDKLIDFKNKIFKDLDEKISKIKDESLKYEKEELEKTKNEVSNKIFINTEKKIEILRSQYKYKLTKKSFDAKKEILVFRDSLIENMLKICKDNIIDFTNSEKYEKYLLNKIDNILNKFSYYNTFVQLKKEDLKFKENILKLDGVLKVTLDKDNVLGGFKIINTEKNIEIDETFGTLLNEAFKNFYKTCALKIENF